MTLANLFLMYNFSLHYDFTQENEEFEAQPLAIGLKKVATLKALFGPNILLKLLLKPEKSGPIKIIRPIEQFYLKFKALVIDNGGR
jgi:hypothetical protein